MLRFSLSTRAFLFSFVPVCLALSASFLALNGAVQQGVRRELREALQESDVLLNHASIEYSRRTSSLLAQLADSAGVKASVGLLPEARGNPAATDQVRRTIEVQLRELQSSTGYDFVAVSDLRGHTLAAVVSPDAPPLTALPSLSLKPGAAEIQHVLYQLESLPINIDMETAAVLTLGRKFDLNALPLGGGAVLMHAGRVVLSTFPSGWNSSLERQIDQVCSRPELSCEITVRGEHFIASQLERTQLGDQYRLLGLRSLDKLLGEFNAAFMRALIQVGLGGAVLALFCMLVTSRSVSRPLRSLVVQLKRSEAIGQMPERLALNKGAYELDSLVNAFNRVGDAERRSRRQLELAMHAAESANRLKTEFLTNVSHELRTPMNGVLGMTDLLLVTPLSAEQEEYAATARGSAESLLTLIDGILDFSKLEAHKLQLSESAFQLQQLVNDVAAGVRLQAEQKQIGIETVYPSSVPQNFIGDCGRIRQVLMELVGNAVKFTDKGRVQIGVKCDRSADNALLTFNVRDTGIGIAPDTHDLIFQKFSQVDGSLTRKRGGTGLGLALSKQLVELMGGQIGFSSHPDAGSTFWFTLSLPVVESEAVLASVSKGAARPC